MHADYLATTRNCLREQFPEQFTQYSNTNTVNGGQSRSCCIILIRYLELEAQWLPVVLLAVIRWPSE